MTLFLVLFSLPMQFVYSVDIFSSGWDFPVTCPQLEREGTFSLLSKFGIFHFPKLFLHAIYSWWYGSSLVLFPALKKEMCNYKPFISPAVMSSACFCLLRAIGKSMTVPVPVPHSPFSTAISCTVFLPCSGPQQFSTLLFHPTYLLPSVTRLTTSVLLSYYQGTDLLISLSYVLFQLPLFFICILTQIQNVYLQVLAAYLTYSLLMSPTPLFFKISS